MNALWERALGAWHARSPRERVLLAIAVGIALLVLLHVSAIRPLQARLDSASARASGLEADVLAAERLANEAVRLRARLASVEDRIGSSSRTQLFTLLEKLAEGAGVKDRLESIKPKQPSGSSRYPETRVEVRLQGATLDQLTQFLYRIEGARLHLIVRSLRVKTQPGKDATLLDVSFSVSSFERA